METKKYRNSIHWLKKKNPNRSDKFTNPLVAGIILLVLICLVLVV